MKLDARALLLSLCLVVAMMAAGTKGDDMLVRVFILLIAVVLALEGFVLLIRPSDGRMSSQRFSHPIETGVYLAWLGTSLSVLAVVSALVGFSEMVLIGALAGIVTLGLLLSMVLPHSFHNK